MPIEIHLGKGGKIIHHPYGGKKGDESKSKRDYMGTKKNGTKKKKTAAKKTYGGKKGDMSKSRRDYS
jgi:hypothetical protein